MRSATVSERGSPPARASRMAAIVVSFGTSGSNGRAFSRATRVSMRRTASDTVMPMEASTAAASSLVAGSIRV